ncbi:hypothetical protein [Paenibacillus sp. cl141a]|nr:hypothetical protein [Paenibacillus sp. cl141a]
MPFLWQAALQANHYAIENEPLQEIPWNGSIFLSNDEFYEI